MLEREPEAEGDSVTSWIQDAPLPPQSTGCLLLYSPVAGGYPPGHPQQGAAPAVDEAP